MLSSVVAQTPRPHGAVLTEEHARERAARVSAVAYHLTLRLDGTSPDYAGNVAIAFDLADARRDLTIDFVGGEISVLEVNGAASDADYNGYFLTLPAAALKSGPNRVRIEFMHPYSTDGAGLYRFTDPADGRHYLYTDFEPYRQNRLFPSFDQPDLKASYASRVSVPADWQVVSVVAPSDVRADERGSASWTFPASSPISTYIFALHAGQYRVWESNAGEIPLRLFARESLAQYIDAEEWFDLTRQGFVFFERYFEIPYPFGKYDQLIVPHYNAGAMENVGAVTFSERFVRRGTVTRQDRRDLASVLLHEMAHMWFGDLVTMEWWNGLWLNESFATFMATLAMKDGTQFTEELEHTYRRTVRAYRADERETTHPIELPVLDTDSAFSNFDAITYEKGAATLKQLNHLVGPETFRRGVSAYLKKHAYGNTAIEDFLGAIAEAADRDLGPWSRDWLHTAGANSIEVELRCARGAIEELAVRQSAPTEWPTLRTHRTQLGLYRFEGDGLAVRTLPVTYSGARTEVAEAKGEPCPELVFANHGDWDYVRVRLDARTIATLDGRLQRFEDPLLRAMLWQGLWDMVLEADLAPSAFIEFALRNLPSEQNVGIVPQVLDSTQLALRYLLLLDAAGSTPAKLAAFLSEQMRASDAGSDRQLAMFDSYVEAAAVAGRTAELGAWLDGSETPPSGVNLDQDRRWNVLQSLAAGGTAELEARLTEERARDVSEQGRLHALAVEAARPDLAVKRLWLERFVDDRALTLAEVRAASAALFPARQHALRAALADDVLLALSELEQRRDSSFFSAFVTGFLGTFCERDYLARVDAAIERAESLHPILFRGLRNHRFEVARCARIAERERQPK